MGGDGVTKVVSRRLPREVEAGESTSPPPFAGVAPGAEALDGDGEGEAGALGEKPAAGRASRGESAAAA